MTLLLCLHGSYYMLPKIPLYPLAYALIIIKQIYALPSIILWHYISLFITNPTPPVLPLIQSLFVPIHLYSSDTSTYYFPFNPVSFMAHTSHSVSLIHASNSICFSLVQIFLTFFHTIFKVDLSFLHFYYSSSLSTPIPSSFPESLLASYLLLPSIHPALNRHSYTHSSPTDKICFSTLSIYHSLISSHSTHNFIVLLNFLCNLTILHYHTFVHSFKLFYRLLVCYVSSCFQEFATPIHS